MWRPDDARHGMCFSEDVCSGTCLPDDECHSILPSRRRVSGYIASGRRVPWLFTFQSQSVRAYFFQMTCVKACGLRTTPATVYDFRTTSASANAFQTQSVKAYFVQTTSVKACGIWTTPATAHDFRMTSVRVFRLSDTACQGIFLADDECQGICLQDTVRQGISFNACRRICFRTVLASAHTAPNACQPCVCVLDEDGHHSSLPGGGGQVNGVLAMRVRAYFSRKKCLMASCCRNEACQRKCLPDDLPGHPSLLLQYSHYMSYALLGVVIHLNELVTINTLLSGVFPPPRDPTHPPSCNTLRSRLSNRNDCTRSMFSTSFPRCRVPRE